jgi:hypothetical protein
VALGVGLIVWRKDVAEIQAMTLGGTMLPGCAIAEGVLCLLVALFLYLAYRAGVLG